MFTGRASDYARQLKEANKNAQGVSQWEEYFLKPLQGEYEAGMQQATGQFNYDISSAFASYKKSQQNATLSNAWTSEKTKYSNYLADTYTSAFSAAAQKQYETYTSLSGQFAKKLSEEEQSLLKEGQKYVDFQRMAYDYAQTNPDMFGEFDPTNRDIMSKYYSTDAQGNLVLNKEGVDFWDKLLNSKATTLEDGTMTQDFAKYLYDENRDMYDFYQSNKENIRELVGGLNRGDFEYSTSERQDVIQADKLQASIEDKVSSLTGKNSLIGEIKTNFDSDVERLQYLTDLDKKVSMSKIYVESPAVTISENNYKVLINGNEYTSDRASGKPLIYRIPSSNTEIKNYGFTFTTKNNPYKTGDVFSFDGKTYWYMLDNKQAIALIKKG